MANFWKRLFRRRREALSPTPEALADRGSGVDDPSESDGPPSRSGTPLVNPWGLQ